MIAVPAEVLAELAALLKERVGLHVRQEGQPALRIALAARLEESPGASADPAAYLALLRSEAGDEELRRLLPLVTVGKTSFFRDERQFRALEALLPELLRRPRAGGRRLAIWSAGCATGEEPYSIAMAAAEAGADPDQVEILATDVNPEAVAFAARGTYDARRVRGIPAPLLARHFDVTGGHSVPSAFGEGTSRPPEPPLATAQPHPAGPPLVSDGERYRVRTHLRQLIAAIRPHNLVSGPFPRPADGGWDVVFCRNVIIYFDTPTTQQVLTQFHAALAPGGYLFLGYSESLFRLFEGFELTEIAGAFVYRRPEAPVRTTPRPSSRPPPPRPPPRTHPSSPPPVRHLDVRPPPTTWLPSPDAPARPAAEPPADASPPLAPQEYLDGAVALFQDGRFGAARELLERALELRGEDLAVRLTLANLYGVLRQPEKAHDSYAAALQLEPLSAEAHLFFAVHLLSQGDAEAAAMELSRALFLDPDLGLAHYYLGRCREAQRDPNRARLAYRNALDAYKRRPEGRRQAFLGYYPDIPEDGAAFARAAEYALQAL